MARGKLHSRETMRQVADLIAAGSSKREAADAVGVPYQTVKGWHRRLDWRGELRRAHARRMLADRDAATRSVGVRERPSYQISPHAIDVDDLASKWTATRGLRP